MDIGEVAVIFLEEVTALFAAECITTFLGVGLRVGGGGETDCEGSLFMFYV
jgi:hypothetical protein